MFIYNNNTADGFSLKTWVADFPPVAHLSTLCWIYGGKRGTGTAIFPRTSLLLRQFDSTHASGSQSYLYILHL